MYYYVYFFLVGLQQAFVRRSPGNGQGSRPVGDVSGLRIRLAGFEDGPATPAERGSVSHQHVHAVRRPRHELGRSH